MKIIREERQKQGISQECLAKLAQASISSVWFWENYRYTPKFDLVVNMLDVLGLEIVIRKKENNG